MRTVLMTTDTVGGVWSFTLDLAETLGEHGVQVIAAALGGKASNAQRAEAARVPNLDVLESGFKLEWMDDPWEDVEESGRWLLDLEEEYAPDVVHLNSYGHGALEWRAPVVVTAHSCVLSWWSAVKQSPLPQSWERYRVCVECSLKAADAVTAPSRAMAGAVEEHYGIAAKVIHNGRNGARFAPAEKEPILLTAGRLWDEAKNVAAAVRASEGLPWPLYLAGTGKAEAGPTYLGRLGADELAGWYGRASIFVLPARYEPFGLGPLEAGLSGCALVLGDIASLHEVWGDAAVFVNPDDDVAIRRALETLIAQPELRQSMSERALTRAREYTASRMGSQYLDLYRTLLTTRRVACAS